MKRRGRPPHPDVLTPREWQVLTLVREGLTNPQITPVEIVQYMVTRVDTVLREELGIADGLADPNVYVLDPCCGTGTFLVEVLKRIAETLHAKGEDALVANDLKRAAMGRVFGFEILPAPFVVSHLQLGLLLQSFGAPLSDKDNERAGVYLTNSLTGWQAHDQPPLAWPELEDERAGSGLVKREKPILVILGNPPYNAFAGVSPTEEEGLVEAYKGVYFLQKAPRRRGKKTVQPPPVRRYRLTDPVSEGGWGIRKFNLDDFYVRFFRLAERRIAEMTGRGVVSFISNFSFLADPSFVIMRQRFLREFDQIWIDCMNGDSRETGKLTPDGHPDPSAFSTVQNKEGIRVGTAISLMVRKETRVASAPVHFRHFWGSNKRADLLASLQASDLDSQYDAAQPNEANRFSFRPSDVTPEYLGWPKVTELAAHEPFNGPIERRGNSLIVFETDRKRLELLELYLDPKVSDSEVAAVAPRFMKSSGEFIAAKARQSLKGAVKFNRSKIVRYPFKPFDMRLAYLDGELQPLFSRPSPELLAQASIAGNSFFITRDTADKSLEGPPFFFSTLVCDYDFISGHARHFPVQLRSKSPKIFEVLPDADATPKANLSRWVSAYLEEVGITSAMRESDAALIWMHALAVGYSPAYLSENADGIRLDWPRIPLPSDKEALLASAELGKQVAALLDTEGPRPGEMLSRRSLELNLIAVICRVGGGSLDPAVGDLAVTAGWGHAGQGGVAMPGKGRVAERQYEPKERQEIQKGSVAFGLSPDDAFDQLGQTCFDVYLNDVAYLAGIPVNVWNFAIGGHQVMKKWLSYRELSLLGHALSTNEVREFTETARRITGLLLLQPQLDANYRRVKAQTYLASVSETVP